MSFKDKTFQERYGDRMWHHSEDRFEASWPHRFTRFGLDQDESTLDTWKLDAFIRYTPDYAVQIGGGPVFLMEVQGTGKDMRHKIKVDKLEVLKRWNRIQDTWLWLWDDKHDRADIVSVNQIGLMVAQGKGTKGSFDGQKRPYWAFPVDVIRDHSDWNPDRYVE